MYFTVLLLAINCYSVNLATGVQNVFTAAKLVAIGIVCLGGVYKFLEGSPSKSDFVRNMTFEILTYYHNFLQNDKKFITYAFSISYF